MEQAGHPNRLPIAERQIHGVQGSRHKQEKFLPRSKTIPGNTPLLNTVQEFKGIRPAGRRFRRAPVKNPPRAPQRNKKVQNNRQWRKEDAPHGHGPGLYRHMGHNLKHALLVVCREEHHIPLAGRHRAIHRPRRTGTVHCILRGVRNPLPSASRINNTHGTPLRDPTAKRQRNRSNGHLSYRLLQSPNRLDRGHPRPQL